MSYVYLAGPYTHQDPNVRQARVERVTQTAAWLSRHNAVYSPLTHGHALAEALPREAVHDHAFWMRQCFPLLRPASALYVLPLEGWAESKGLRAEMDFAEVLRIPIVFLSSSHPEILEPRQADIPVRVTYLFLPATALESPYVQA